jgi:hypothetical protein
MPISEKQLKNIERIYEQSARRINDSIIAKELGLKPEQVMAMRKFLGFSYRRISRDITENEFKTTLLDNGRQYLKFSLSKEQIDEMGFNLKNPLTYIGKLEGKKLILSFR